MAQDTYTGQTSDPLSLNLYTYVSNNPLRYWDPTGHAQEFVLKRNDGATWIPAAGGYVSTDGKLVSTTPEWKESSTSSASNTSTTTATVSKTTTTTNNSNTTKNTSSSSSGNIDYLAIARELGISTASDSPYKDIIDCLIGNGGFTSVTNVSILGGSAKMDYNQSTGAFSIKTSGVSTSKQSNTIICAANGGNQSPGYPNQINYGFNLLPQITKSIPEKASKTEIVNFIALARAIEYLSTSPKALELISILTTEPEEIFTIIFTNELNDAYLRNTIYWNPNAGLVLGDNKSILSAALGLAHEMGHAAQYLSRDYDEIFNAKRRSKAQTLALEEANLASWEIPIAKELGEYTRANYGDAIHMYMMESSTDWGIKIPWYKRILPGSKIYENQNTWTPAQTWTPTPL